MSLSPSPAPTRDEWKQIMMLLDTALELEPAARTAWLDSLAAEHRPLLPRLKELLDSQAEVANSDFLTPAALLPAMPEPPSEPEARSEVGPYRLLREIGQGGMATVWLAERADGLLERRVALKLPHLSWGVSSFAERMARERNILASLAHPNIARLYDVGIAADGRPFLALEYVDGLPVTTYATTHGLAVRERVGLIVQVARAVAHAHARLIVHRDLKPSNILVDAQGRAHLLDFGIAKLIEMPRADTDGLAADATITHLHGRALTPDYASPEQIRGDAIDTASDIYSLGIVLFELLAGERPYTLARGLGPVALAEILERTDLPRPSEAATDLAVRRQVEGDLDAIVGRATRKEGGERYATIDALADDLERHLRGEPVAARPDSRWYRIERWIRRHKLETAVAAAIVVAVPAGAVAQAAVLTAIGAGAGVALWQLRLARHQAQVAKQEAARAEQVKDFTLSILHGANPEVGAGAATTAADVLKAACTRIERELSAQPAISVELMTSVGWGLLGLGALDDGAEILRKAVALARSSLGSQHPHTPAAIVAYAAALETLDRWKEAIPLLLPAIAEARRQNLNHTLLDGLRWLSTCRLHEGDFDAAVELAQAAVNVVVDGDSAVRKMAAAQAWQGLANALSAARREGVAEAASQGLALANELSGGVLTETVINARMMLARGLGTEGRDSEALATLDAVWRDINQFFGPSAYRWIALIANARGHVRLNAGNVAGAIEDFRAQMEATLRRSGGDAGVHLGAAHSSLGKALLAARLDEEALQHYETSARLFSEATHPGHLHVLRSLSVRAFLLARLGRLDDAEQAFDAIDDASWGGQEAERAAHLGRISVLRSLQGRHDQAIALARASVDGQRSLPAKIIHAKAMSGLGAALLAAGRPAKAIEPLRHARRLYAETQLMMSPDQADTIAALASAEAAPSQPHASSAHP